MNPIDDKEPCRMRNVGGSENGTCSCQTPKDCQNLPQFTPVGMKLAGIIDQFMAKTEAGK